MNKSLAFLLLALVDIARAAVLTMIWNAFFVKYGLPLLNIPTMFVGILFFSLFVGDYGNADINDKEEVTKTCVASLAQTIVVGVSCAILFYFV